MKKLTMILTLTVAALFSLCCIIQASRIQRPGGVGHTTPQPRVTMMVGDVELSLPSDSFQMASNLPF